MGTKLAVECADYFRARPGWKRPLEAVWKKFRSTGRAGGVVRIPDPSLEECQAVSQLLARPAAPPELKFSLRELEQALGETRFAGVGLHELLEAYFNKPLISRRDTAELRRLQRRDFFRAARDAAAPEAARSWIPDWISEMEERKTCGYQMVIRELEASPEKAARLLQTVCKGLALLESQEAQTAVGPDRAPSTRQAAAPTASLPFTRLRLAVFSAQVTADPHFFDRQNVAGKLLLHGLAFWKGCPFPVSSEETLELYYAAGLIPDSISSFTAQIGLRLYPAAESGVEHPAYRYFREHGEEMLLSLSELYRIDGADSPSGMVFVVENQMVFSQLCETARNVGASMVCTSGQMKTASLYLLDLLAAAGCELHYSGDFDPEGLVIADRLLTRYPDQMTLWHMGVDDYRMLTPGGTLGTGRMAMLERLKSPELLAVAAEMRKKGTAAYQELLLDVLEQDMRESI